MEKISIIGSGSWGVALAIHLAKLGHIVKIWSFTQEEADLINKERKCKFLPRAVIPDGVYCTTDIQEAIQGSNVVLHVTPSKFVRSTIKQYKTYITSQQIIMCSKGFEKETLSTLYDVLNEELPDSSIGVFSGPSHAEEVSLGIPTAMVIASENEDILKNMQDIFMCETMRVYTSNDVKGVELGGALKNIIAFCAGAAKELNLGDNSFAALITRGLAEISKLGIKMGGKQDTFYGLTGLGDLIVTCQSEHSRNRKAGMLIGRGVSIEETRKEIGMTIESIDNIEVAYELSKIHQVEMPIVNIVYEVLYQKLDPKEAVKILMTRDKKRE